MLRRLLIVSLLCCSIVELQSQDLPAWVTKLPKAGNDTYMYVIESAVGETENDARNQANIQVLKKTIDRLGQAVSSSAVYEAIQKGVDLEVISQDFKIPINNVCEHFVILKDGKVRMYILYQVAKTGNVTPVWDEFRGCKDIKQFNNGVALAESIFIPGLGQMCKRHYTEGALTLTGEILLVSAGFGCYFVSREELNIMKTPNITYEQFSHAYKTYNTLRTTSYVIWGAAAALYIFNLCRAYTLQPKYKETLAVYPALIPNNHNTAVGVGLTLNFK